MKEHWKETMSYLWHEFEDEDLKRMFQKYSQLGTAALPEDLNQRLIQAKNSMQTIYAKATICSYQDKTKCDLHVEPGKNYRIFQTQMQMRFFCLLLFC